MHQIFKQKFLSESDGPLIKGTEHSALDYCFCSMYSTLCTAVVVSKCSINKTVLSTHWGLVGLESAIAGSCSPNSERSTGDHLVRHHCKDRDDNFNDICSSSSPGLKVKTIPTFRGLHTVVHHQAVQHCKGWGYRGSWNHRGLPDLDHHPQDTTGPG